MHAGVHAGVAVDRLLDGGHGGVVGGLAVEAHPQLARAQSDDLVAGDGASDVGADRLHTGNGAQLAAGPPVMRCISVCEVPGAAST